MKQGSASRSDYKGKTEPMPKAVNPGTVADIGIQQVRYRPHKDLGRGYKAPMASSSTHPSGSQGKH